MEKEDKVYKLNFIKNLLISLNTHEKYTWRKQIHENIINICSELIKAEREGLKCPEPAETPYKYIKAKIYHKDGGFMRQYNHRLRMGVEATPKAILDAVKGELYFPATDTTRYNNHYMRILEPTELIAIKIPNTEKDWERLYNHLEYFTAEV